MDANDLALLLLRTGIGVTIFLHGWNKVFGGGRLPGTGQWFESMGMRPGWLHARLAAGTEMGCGALMVLGFLTPFAAAGIVGLMTVAGIVAHRHNGFFIFLPGGGWEYVLIFGLAAGASGTLGAGYLSIDHAIGLDGGEWWTFAVSFGLGLVAAALLLALCWRPAPRTVAS